jgi:hypothetical protein
MMYASPTPHVPTPPVVTNATVTQDSPVITNVLTLMNVSLTITIVMLMPIVSIIMDHMIAPVNPDMPWSTVIVLTLTNALLVTTPALKTVTVSTPMVHIDASARTVITATDIHVTMIMNVEILPVLIPRTVLIILEDLTVFVLRATPASVLSARTSMNAIAIHVTIMHLVQIPPVHTLVPVIQDSLDPVLFALIVTSAEPVPTPVTNPQHATTNQVAMIANVEADSRVTDFHVTMSTNVSNHHVARTPNVLIPSDPTGANVYLVTRIRVIAVTSVLISTNA